LGFWWPNFLGRFGLTGVPFFFKIPAFKHFFTKRNLIYLKGPLFRKEGWGRRIGAGYLEGLLKEGLFRDFGGMV